MLNCFLFVSLTFISNAATSSKVNCSNTMNLITSRGCPAESHTVETEDGYILTMHRIARNNSVHYPVYLQHGFLASSESWIVRGRQSDLAFLLYDAGYDVWMGNVRGNYHSKKHKTLKITQEKFWEFGWHEMAIYDVPSMIDTILNITNHKKVIYVGHSMGTTMFFAMMAKKPQYNDKVAVHISLAPVVFMKYFKLGSKVKFIVDNAFNLHTIINQLKMYDAFKRDQRMTTIVHTLCGNYEIYYHICLEFLFYTIGVDFYQTDQITYLGFACYFPSGGSSQTMLHYAQNVRSGKFLEFSYGKKENLIKYGTESPPAYNVSSITAPVYLYYSRNDELSSELDTENLAQQLQNVKKYRVPYKYFNHWDYLTAIDGKRLLYDKILKDLDEF